MYSFCLDANKRNSDLDVNNGFSGAQGRLFKILKTLIFSSTNPLENCIIYICRKVSYSSFSWVRKRHFSLFTSKNPDFAEQNRKYERFFYAITIFFYLLNRISDKFRIFQWNFGFFPPNGSEVISPQSSKISKLFTSKQRIGLRIGDKLFF